MPLQPRPLVDQLARNFSDEELIQLLEIASLSLDGYSPDEARDEVDLNDEVLDELGNKIKMFMNSERCVKCHATYPAAGDGWNGHCPDCADRREKSGATA